MQARESACQVSKNGRGLERVQKMDSPVIVDAASKFGREIDLDRCSIPVSDVIHLCFFLFPFFCVNFFLAKEGGWGGGGISPRTVAFVSYSRTELVSGGFLVS